MYITNTYMYIFCGKKDDGKFELYKFQFQMRFVMLRTQKWCWNDFINYEKWQIQP